MNVPNSKFIRSAVHPVPIYIPSIGRLQKTMNGISQTKLLYWISYVTQHDHIRNGYVICAIGISLRMIELSTKVDGKRAKQRAKWGNQ